MKQGIYTGNITTWHQKFGVLVPETVYDLPDEWDFEHETLFVPVGMPVIAHADNAEKFKPAKASGSRKIRLGDN